MALAPGKSLGLRKMLIGREVESARLATALASARAGAGAAFVLVGEPGIGKTTLLRGLVDQAEQMTVLETAGVESEADLPYAALIDVLQPVLHRLDALPEAQAVALSTALALGPPGVVDRFAVGVATLGLLAAAAEDGPALIVVDDLQWVDSASRDALSFAARRLTGIPAIFVAAQRAGAPPVPGLHVVPVGPLDREDATRVLAENERTDCAGGAGEDPRCRSREPACAGRVASPADARPARRAPRRWRTRSRRRTASSGPSPRASRPSPPAAVWRPWSPRRTAPAPPVSCSARSARWGSPSGISAKSNRWDCCTSRRTGSTSAIPWSGPPPTTAPTRPSGGRVHAALAAADSDPDRRAWHLAAATVGLDDAIADELDRAGARALARGAFGAGAAALERAASLTEARAARGARLLRAANAMDAAGNLVRSQALAHEAAHLIDDPRLHAELVILLGRLRMAGGEVEAGHAMLLEEAEQVGELDPALAAALLSFAANLPVFRLEGSCRRRVDGARVEAGRSRRGRGRRPSGTPTALAKTMAGDPAGPALLVELALEARKDVENGHQMGAAVGLAARLGGGVRRRPHSAHLGRGRAAVGRLAAAPAAVADRARRARLPGRPLGACPRRSLRGDRVVRGDGPADRARVRSGDDRPHGGRSRPGRRVPPSSAGGLRCRRRVRPPASERAGRRGARTAGARPGRSRRRDRGARAGRANRRGGQAR